MIRIENFAGRVAVVTGAASGIGQGIAASLVAAGATVVIADIDSDGAERAAHALGAHARHVDVTSPAGTLALAEDVISRFGRVDILVNNAGVGPLSTFDDLTTADFDWVMDINFRGVVHGIKSFLPLLLANPHGGYIVNTASVAAILPAHGTAAYAASKAAVVAVSETLALELSDRARVGVSILFPALVRSNITVNARNRPGHHEGGPRTEDFLPPGRVLEPSQVGEMVIAAMRAGERHIFTHPETRPLVEQHCRTLLSAYGCWTAKETTDL
jgi:NAD(P)-dependent dehydrogenase (short-subunit alcohol dehydrogenase family)